MHRTRKKWFVTIWNIEIYLNRDNFRPLGIFPSSFNKAIAISLNSGNFLISPLAATAGGELKNLLATRIISSA